MNTDFSTKPVITLSLYFPRQVSHIHGIHFMFWGEGGSKKKPGRWLDQPFVYHTHFKQIRFFFTVHRTRHQQLEASYWFEGQHLTSPRRGEPHCTAVWIKTHSKACWVLKWNYFFPPRKTFSTVLRCFIKKMPSTSEKLPLLQHQR